MSGFIKEHSFLEEDYRIIDLFDFSKIIKSFGDKLTSITKNSVIGLVGKFGSGKSTMLYQIYKDKSEDDEEKWINFDAWKYPDRNDLWEGFVLDFADQIGERKRVRARIEGKGTKSKVIDVATDILSEITDRLPDLNFIEKFTDVFKRSPATRVFEIQEILKGLITKVNKDLYIIVEDIDRSGDKGMFFLETLRHFIKENKFDKKIVIIVPIGDEALKEKSDPYAKCLDYYFDFQASDIKFNQFITNVFAKEAVESDGNFVPQIDLLFRNLIRSKGITPRDIKKIIRIANVEYQELIKDGKKWDIRLILNFIALRVLNEKTGSHYVNDHKIIGSSVLNYSVLIWIANTDRVLTERELVNYISVSLPIYVVEEELANHIYYDTHDRYNDHGSRGAYYLSKKYLDNLGIS